MDKKLEDMTFQEIVAWQEGEILQDLLKGKFQSGVYNAMSLALRWYQEKELAKKKKGK